MPLNEARMGYTAYFYPTTFIPHPDGIEPDPAGIVRHADGGDVIITS